MFNSFGALRVPIQTTHTFSGGSSSPILVKLTGMYEYYIVEYVNRANFCYSSALFHWRSWARGGVLGKRIDAKKWRFNIYSTKNLSIIPDRLAWMAFYAGGQPTDWIVRTRTLDWIGYTRPAMFATDTLWITNKLWRENFTGLLKILSPLPPLHLVHKQARDGLYL